MKLSTKKLLIKSAIALVAIGIVKITPTTTSDITTIPEKNNDQVVFKDNFSVHMIDVGQADAILIQNDDNYMMIDAGNRGDEDVIQEYLTDFEIDKLDYFIGTHPHEDHIGSASMVIEEFIPDTIMLPEKIATTKVFKEMLTSIQNNEKQITVPEVGEVFKFGDDSFVVLSPNEVKNDTNNNSIVIMYTHTNPNGDTKWLFTGDAEVDIETELLNRNIDLDADVLKAGHHGSNTSSSEDFVKAVSPELVLISCGLDNEYGHPHEETISLLESLNITYKRTDLDGTIVAKINDQGGIYVEE